MLIAREDGVDEDEPRGPRPEMAKLMVLLQRLHHKDRAAIVQHFSGGQSQSAIASREQLSQPGLNERIQRAIIRLRWLAGVGSWYTEKDIRRDLNGKMSRDHITALCVIWTTSNYKEVQRRLGYTSHSRAWSVVRQAIAQLRGRYREAFEKLLAQGSSLREAPRKPFSALKDFLASRVVFDPGARVALAPLAASYERHAVALSRPWDVDKLVEAIERRGAKPVRMRVPWTRGPVRGFEGALLKFECAQNAPKTALSTR